MLIVLIIPLYLFIFFEKKASAEINDYILNNGSYASILNHPCTKKIYKQFDYNQQKLESIILAKSKSLGYYPLNKYGWRFTDIESEFYNVKNGRRKVCFNNSKDNNIIILGGSTTWGIGVEDCDTIPSKLQQSYGNKFAINNLSIPGFYSFYEKELFLENYRNYANLKKVIFLDGLNELYYESNDEPKKNKRFFHNYMYKFFGKYNLFKLHLIKKHDSLKNKNISNLSECTKYELKPNKTVSNSDLNFYTNRYLEYYKEVTDICEKIMIKCYFFLQPIPSKDYPNAYEFANSNGGYNDLQYGRYNDFVDNIMSKKLNNIYDISDIIKHVEYSYIDKVHYSPSASSIIANIMFQITNEK